MKTIFSNIIPFRGFFCVNVFGLVFVRNDHRDKLTWQDLNHEAIHTVQMRELLYVFFYIIYLFEWVFRLAFIKGDAYYGMSFEREAYDNEGDIDYLKTRKHFAQWRKKK